MNSQGPTSPMTSPVLAAAPPPAAPPPAAPPPAAPSTIDITVQCDRQTACHNTQCPQEHRRGYGAEIKCLNDMKVEVTSRKCKLTKSIVPSKLTMNKNAHRNQIQNLKKEQKQFYYTNSKTPKQKPTNNKQTRNKQKTKTLLQGIIDLRPRITAMVKPGVKLLSVTSDTLPPPDSCTTLITGTNDRLLDVLYSFGLEWAVSLPTRVTATSSTAIDKTPPSLTILCRRIVIHEVTPEPEHQTKTFSLYIPEMFIISVSSFKGILDFY
ncbi:hypothetical protein J6590_035314 [Homalodisca vitripennis]|nr:hypothetical protein J6590_035314 [Homalodisca vitripennis]